MKHDSPAFLVEEGALIGLENMSDNILPSNFVVNSNTSIFITWKRKDFNECLRNEIRRSLAERIEFFRNLDIFENNETALLKFANAFTEKIYYKNEIIYNAGDASDCIFWVAKGELYIKV